MLYRILNLNLVVIFILTCVNFIQGQTKYRVTADKLIIRNLPDKTGEKIGIYKSNEIIEIDTIIENWGRVALTDSSFVSMDYLSTDLTITENQKEQSTKKEDSTTIDKKDFFTNFIIAFFISWFFIAYLSWNKTTDDGRFSSGKRIVSLGLGFGCLTQIIIALIIAIAIATYRYMSA